MHDKHGRPYALVSEVVEGTKLVADPGFDCIKPGTVLEVKADEDNILYVSCSNGTHTLDGQIDTDKDTSTQFYTGFYLDTVVAQKVDV